MYNTIGQCEDCKESPRFLQFVSFDEVGIEQIALCAHGCDDRRSIAYPPEDMVNAAVRAEISRLKQEEYQVNAAVEQRICLYERILEHNQSNLMEEEDWVRIIEVSNRMAREIRHAIDQCESLPQKVFMLEQQERFYKELGRYAVGQSM